MISCSRFDYVKKARKFERFDFKYRKALLETELLQSCKKQPIPTSLQFKVANKQVESSEAYLVAKGIY